MANFYLGAGGILGERSDLGFVVPRWQEQYMGPDSQYVSMRSTGLLPVNKGGRINLPRQNWLNVTNLTNQRYRRMPGESTPVAHPHELMTINVTPTEHGQAERWDDTQQDIQEMIADGGTLMVDEHMTMAALSRTAQALDQTLLALLDAASTPFDATDTAAGVVWSTSATATPIADIQGAKVKLGASILNSVILEYTHFEEFRAIAELTNRFGGNVGAGTLTDDLVASAWASFGIRNVFVAADTSPITNKAILFALDSSLNPRQGYCALIRATQGLTGGQQTAEGISISVRQVDHHIFETYAPMMADFAIDAPGGARITGV